MTQPLRSTVPGARCRIAFLLSGGGSTFANLCEYLAEHETPADVVAVVSDRKSSGGLALARSRDIPSLLVPRTRHKGAAYSRAIEAALHPYDVDLIVMGGFLTLFPLPGAWADRTINVHPALLPAFGGKGCYGLHVHRKVLDRGCRVSGCTVHVVTNDVDAGPILEQVTVRVHAADTPETLAERVRAAERLVYPRVIEALVRGTLRIEAGAVLRAP